MRSSQKWARPLLSTTETVDHETAAIGRFFVAQVVTLQDPWLEKLYVYASWLVRLLPSLDVPADINVSDVILRLDAFKLVQSGSGSA